MTSTEFKNRMKTIAKNRSNILLRKNEVNETLEVIREFSQDLINDLTDVLNGRVSSDTVSIIIEVLNMITNGYRDKETIQSKILLEAYKLGLQVKETSITVENPF